MRWLVAHEALLHGPWNYCTLLRELVGDRQPTETFPRQATRVTSRVFVFDLAKPSEKAARRLPWGSASDAAVR